MPTIKTKWFASTMAGAPALSGSVGAMIAVLDACLKDGFNLVTLTSLVIAGNVATGTKAGHGYVVNQVLDLGSITGACAVLNGNVRLTSVTTDTFQFSTSGLADQTATGTITAKAAPAGWLKPFSGTNLATYKSGNVLSSQISIKVDDTVALYASVLGAESFTDISTPVNSFGTQYFKKSNAASAAVRPWIIVADDKSVYLGIAWTDTGVYDFYHFGDFNSLVAGDAANFRLQGLTASAPGTIGQYSSVSSAYVGSPNNSICPRPYSQIFGAINIQQGSLAAAVGFWGTASAAQQYGYALSGNHGYAAIQNYDVYVAPALSDNGYHFVPVFLFEAAAAGKIMRGASRGLLHMIESAAIASGYNILTGVDGISSGLVLMVASAGTTSQNTAYPSSVIAFDLGDWA